MKQQCPPKKMLPRNFGPSRPIRSNATAPPDSMDMEIKWHFSAPRSCWSSHSHTTSSSEATAPTPISAAFPIFHHPRHRNPRQLRNFGLPFVGHARAQRHLHAAVPVLESPSPTTAGFPRHKLQELQTINQEGGRRKNSGKHRWENSPGHISTSWDSTGDTTH